MPHLHPDDCARYWDDGFLTPIDVIDPDEATALRTDLESLEATWLNADLPHPLNTYKRVNAHLVMPLACRIGCDPRLLDPVESILGPDILIWSIEFFIKEPRTEAIVSMHQDLTYWGFGAIDGLVTAWLALSQATPASGCMDFVRGSHKNPILPHDDTHDARNLLSRGQEIRVDIAETDKTPIELRPGQMSLHHGLTIHGSGPNHSDDRRIGAVIRYCRPDIAQKADARDYAIIARGADRDAHFISVAPPTEPFSPSCLRLYDEVRRAQAQVLMRGASQDARGLYA